MGSPEMGFHYSVCIRWRALSDGFVLGPGQSCQRPWGSWLSEQTVNVNVDPRVAGLRRLQARAPCIQSLARAALGYEDTRIPGHEDAEKIRILFCHMHRYTGDWTGSENGVRIVWLSFFFMRDTVCYRANSKLFTGSPYSKQWMR